LLRILVGKSIKHITMRFKLLQNQSSIYSVLEAIISVINKVRLYISVIGFKLATREANGAKSLP